MKILGISLACVLALASCAPKADNSGSEPTQGSKVLVAYFSATGTTKAQAEAIAKATEANLYEIKPEAPYTSDDLNWRDGNSRSSVEMADSTSRPALSDESTDAASFDIVFIGFPIWWDLPPRPVNTWIESQNLAGKKVIPFATSGGSTIDNSVKTLKELYPSIDWQEGKMLNCLAAEATTWAKTVIEENEE